MTTTIATAPKQGAQADAVRHPLDALLRPLWPCGVADVEFFGTPTGPRIIAEGGGTAPAWLRSGRWHVYAGAAEPSGPPGSEVFARFILEDGRVVYAHVDPTGDVVVPFSLREALEMYLTEGWTAAGPGRGLSTGQLDAFYRVKRVLPRPVQLALRRLLIRVQGRPSFPRWPLDTSVSNLLRFFAHCRLRAAELDRGDMLWFWPDSYHAAIVLTHDVEDSAGVKLALELADLEEEHGFRSSFNFGAWYDVDPGVLRHLSERGFEIGLHGLTHDRALFASRQAFESRLPALRQLADRLGAVGFRSPATHRIHELLAELPVSYDCTVPNSDPYEPQPGGCCSVLPFFVGEVVELPYTLPQDHTLFTLLRQRGPSLWLEQAENIERSHGLIQCVSHPDPGYLGDRRKRGFYAEFLQEMATRNHVWRALPGDVAGWWRKRASADPTDTTVPRGLVRLTDEPSFVRFEPPAHLSDSA